MRYLSQGLLSGQYAEGELLLVSSQLDEVINLLQKSSPAIRPILQHCDVRMRAAPRPHTHKQSSINRNILVIRKLFI